MKTAKNLFITGIGTGVGKTVVSAVFVEQLQADYWKPIQSGDLDCSDTDQVKKWTHCENSRFHPERYRLSLAASPHKSAAQEGILIKPTDFVLPKTNNRLIIEGAGGVLVPISDDFYMIDLIERLEAAVVLVVRDYLGCINHSLLSIAHLKQRGIPIAQLVFNGAMDPASERVILKSLDSTTQLVRIPELQTIDYNHIKHCKLT
ncbi:dethiobiotin synthase [Flavobacterium sp. JP2137]|uniref:dethiobiotin synthase n=1 Tax=Flavobacterium sp. JP2137 TaxID=3414510 RepID=UPI003D2FD3EF